MFRGMCMNIVLWFGTVYSFMHELMWSSAGRDRDVVVCKGAWFVIVNDVIDCKDVPLLRRMHWNNCGLRRWCALRKGVVNSFDANHDALPTLMVHGRCTGRAKIIGAWACGVLWGGVSPSNLETISGAHKWCMDYAKRIMKPDVSVCLEEKYTFTSNCPLLNTENVLRLLLKYLTF